MKYYCSEFSELSASCWSFSAISSRETSLLSSTPPSSAGVSFDWGAAAFCNSAKSSFETWIFSGTFLALLVGNIGVPLFEISPLYKFSKSSPMSSSSSLKSSTCSICFLSL